MKPVRQDNNKTPCTSYYPNPVSGIFLYVNSGAFGATVQLYIISDYY